MSIYRLLPFLALLLLLASQTTARGDELPSDAATRLKEFEAEAEAIRKKADAEIQALRDKLLADLRAMLGAYTRAGKLDEAVAIRERIRQLQAVTDKYLILPIDKVASAVSTKTLFSGGDHQRMIFPTWGRQEVLGIPFDVIDPKGDSVKNAIVLYGPLTEWTREMPKFVRLKCGSPAKAIHLLSGVACWGYIGNGGRDDEKTVSMLVRLHYRDAAKEDHELVNGVHFCDYCDHNGDGKYPDVPGSRLAIRLLEAGGHVNHIRYLAIQPKNPAKVIEEIEFIKGMKGDITAPVIMAVTVERPVPAAGKVGDPPPAKERP
jgi:hypothetical protein